jgi:NADH-quinone oxidoreductase subunit N
VAVISIAMLVTVGVGVFPEPVLQLAHNAAAGLFIR